VRPGRNHGRTTGRDAPNFEGDPSGRGQGRIFKRNIQPTIDNLSTTVTPASVIWEAPTKDATDAQRAPGWRCSTRAGAGGLLAPGQDYEFNQVTISFLGPNWEYKFNHFLCFLADFHLSISVQNPPLPPRDLPAFHGVLGNRGALSPGFAGEDFVPCVPSGRQNAFLPYWRTRRRKALLASLRPLCVTGVSLRAHDLPNHFSVSPLEIAGA